MSQNRTANARLIEALAAGENITRAATLAGVSTRTVTRRLADEKFRDAVDLERGRIVERASGRLANSMVAAIATLRKLLRSTKEPVQLQAARSLLEFAVRLRSAVETDTRIDELEGSFVRLGEAIVDAGMP